MLSGRRRGPGGWPGGEESLENAPRGAAPTEGTGLYRLPPHVNRVPRRRATEDDLAAMESVLYRTAASRTVMGTASTMAILSEALGMSLQRPPASPRPTRGACTMRSGPGVRSSMRWRTSASRAW